LEEASAEGSGIGMRELLCGSSRDRWKEGEGEGSHLNVFRLRLEGDMK
jgi:hypothetical protein